MPAIIDSGSGNPGYLTGPALHPAPTVPTGAPTQQPSVASTVPGSYTGPYDAPVPNGWIYNQAANLANTAYGNALARLNQSRTSTLRQYGYTAGIDPKSGTISNVQVNPNDPYGLYQEMLRTGALSGSAAQQAGEERGLGAHGGLAEQAVTDAKHQFGADSKNLGEGLQNTLAGFQDQQSQAAYARDEALYQAELTQAQDAINNQAFDPASYAGLNVYGGDNSSTESHQAEQAGAKTPAPGKQPTAPTSRAPSNAARLVAQMAPRAVKVSANKTGASKNKKQGIFSIH